MGLAVIFSGQGTQHPRMLAWLDSEPAAAQVLAQMANQLGANWRERAEDPAWATSNRIAQPLLAGVQLAAWSCLAPRLPQAVAVAGYSVGELAAFAAAGVLAPSGVLELAVLRAQAMDRAIDEHPAGMAAVRDLPLPGIEEWCRRHGLAIAIRLAADRAIVGGLEPALERALTDPVLAAARVDRLAVRVPSHTPWMEPAAAEFAAQLKKQQLRAPAMPLICNLTGAAEFGAQNLAACLSWQIASPVAWDRCMAALAERGARCVLEIGPGSALASMWRERYPEIPVRSADEFRSATAVVQWARRTLGDAAS